MFDFPEPLRPTDIKRKIKDLFPATQKLYIFTYRQHYVLGEMVRQQSVLGNF